MSVTTTNLIQGPATLYKGNFGAVEPLDTAVNTVPAASSWTDLGGTQDGVKLSVDQNYSELEVDQITLRVGSRLTKQDFTIETSLAEATLENLSISLNGGTAASGAGWKSYDPDVSSSATQPSYFAIIMDGYAPNQFTRRVIGRRMLNTESSELAYTKDKQTLIPVKFAGHYVSASIRPFHIVDQTS
ncbi:hypothetical protein OG481_02190 [Streptomyces longwoodensis]|uniref:hypothetical protein n=1 Tax=Streptomyces longwoodensis TaxID=68231 RepID=UPI002DDAA9F1|nr:hypothetical protein [Streptomyces longwoodensis]WRY87403.1 hypothetical protein OG481_02190 [Streptomyces longwoodensis]